MMGATKTRSNPRLKTIAEESACPSVRRHFCARYEACLTRAAVMDWPTFSCDQCRVNEWAAPIDEPQGRSLIADAEAWAVAWQ